MTRQSFQDEHNFFETWNIYQTIVGLDVMFHSDIIAMVKGEIEKVDEPSILDLGCGDAYVVSKAVGKDQLICYVGVDTSNQAIDYAKKLLAPLSGDFRFVENDFLGELETIEGRFDVIISGYTLHHLQSSEKQRFVQLVASKLSDNGVFIFYDAIVGDNETRGGFIDRLALVIEQQWGLDEQMVTKSVEHIRSADLPETEAFYRECFKRAGLKYVEKAFVDPNQLFAGYLVRCSDSRVT